MAIPAELESGRLTLRRLHPDDAAFILRLLNEPSFIQNIGDRAVRTLDDARRYIEAGPLDMYRKFGFGLWHVARKSDGAAMGVCGLLKRDNLSDVDVGYALLPEFWGQGFAFEAAQATLRQAAARFGLRRVIAVVSEGNSGSIRVLEKLGMQFERKIAMAAGEPEVRLYGCTLEPSMR